MKKHISLAAAALSAALLTGQLYAQNGQTTSEFSVTHPIKDNSKASVAAPSAIDAAAGTTNLRAIKDFRSRFTNVGNEHWSLIDKGFCAYFRNEGYSTRAYYDRKGYWQASVKYCDETQLPRFIRDVVKRAYYDLSITGVIIASVPQHTAYIINLEDKDTLTIVRVNDEAEMEVVHEYTKTH